MFVKVHFKENHALIFNLFKLNKGGFKTWDVVQMVERLVAKKVTGSIPVVSVIQLNLIKILYRKVAQMVEHSYFIYNKRRSKVQILSFRLKFRKFN